MSRSLPFKPSAITSALVVAWVAAACGHTSLTLDAYENAKAGKVTTGAGGEPGSAGGASNGTAGTPTSTEQYSCTAVRSQQFDSNFMQAYSEPADVTDNVN